MFRTRRLALALLILVAAPILQAQPAQQPEAIQYVFRVSAPASHVAEIEARFPAGTQATTLDLMMPVWTPGFYGAQDYAARVQDLTARTPDGTPLEVTKPRPNRWQVRTNGTPSVVVSYRLLCEGRSVTTNWVGGDLGVINGGAAFITLVENARRPHDVEIAMPPGWTSSASGLDPALGGRPNHYRAPDFDTLDDSLIVAGNLDVREFVVDGSTHVLVDAGDHPSWNGARAAADLEKMVREVRTFWGFLPFKRYVFLNVFRQGGGGLEHSNSTLLTSSPKLEAPTRGWLSFVAHEYFHAFNVKRLRPIELGPFDYENPPKTSSLWISEGVTTYFANLMLVRSGLTTQEEFLGSISSAIADLQKAPGRLAQTLEQSSLEVWTNSNSGVGPKAGTVSYYVKGHVVGFLLDAHIRKLTNGSRSFDDVMRLAYRRYGGERGFTADQFRETVEEVARSGMKPWFRKAIASTEELVYGEALNWYGLRFATAGGAEPARSWDLEVRPSATDAQRRHLKALLTSAGPPTR
jgi:predicted metalloprotease with PDZ domain